MDPMKLKLSPRNLLLAALLGASAWLPAYAGDGHAVHWGYSGEEGPEHWGDLSAEYTSCKLGQQQSPIDVRATDDKELTPLTLKYQAAAIHAVNNGHTVQYTIDNGSELQLGERGLKLLQVHFHAPSEHHINGVPFPAEAHFVHRDANGKLAVIGVMFVEGAANATLESWWRYMPDNSGQHLDPADAPPVDPHALLPADLAYYTYAGSLTTPPCSEGVTWIVLKQPVEVSRAQIERFRAAMHEHDNNRPLQPLHARVVQD